MRAVSRKAESLPFSHIQHKNCAPQKLPEKFPATQRSLASSAGRQGSNTPTNSAPAVLAVPAQPAAAAQLLYRPSAAEEEESAAELHFLPAQPRVPLAL